MELPTGFTAPSGGQELARELLVAAIAALFVLPAAFGDRGWPLAVLRSRPLVAVGIVSYGVYLWHLPVLELLVREEVLVAPATGVLAALCLPPTLVLAAASWFGLERPLLRASHRWPRPRRG
jgi:peptidoglycan/LPS O-acetylase OafA/YrhL